jgi:predicted DNA-binding protein
MSIPSDFRKDWDFLNKRSKIEGMTPAELIRDLIEEYLEEFQEEAAHA